MGEGGVVWLWGEVVWCWMLFNAMNRSEGEVDRVEFGVGLY